mmetsp:Transcript_8805/g.25888  ORF Transcript_8805/g.25888 Transcript_8805/m.25888 type:complete len:171 (+) Transcript_8805:29-541(+)
MKLALALCFVLAEGRDVVVGVAAGSDVVQRRMLVQSSPPPSVATYIDLSLPLVIAAAYNAHPDAVALSTALDEIDPSAVGFKGYVVLKGTEVVAERYDVGDATSTYHVWSCTKSWAAAMIGELLYAGPHALHKARGHLHDAQLGVGDGRRKEAADNGRAAPNNVERPDGL